MMIFMNYNMKRIDYQIGVRKNKIENALSNLKCEKNVTLLFVFVVDY